MRICTRYNITPQKPPAGSKLGIALGTLGQLPIHGLRLPETMAANGWYVWCGESEQSTAEDFYSPLHIEHVADYLPIIEPYLSLPPGYRFIIDNRGYEDVWFDSALLTHDD